MPSKFKYDVFAEVVADGGTKISKYVSCSSGMTVCVAEVNGTLVRGYLTLATEAFDDDGLPHTLEHLVFLGSEKYPYKGVLDMIANRCLVEEKDADTETDYTVYKLRTAGDKGFLKILPIYLDHLLFPTLTDASFTTEIHHINGEGEDAGALYCEVQGRENKVLEICSRTMLRAMYPGHCGYKSATDGLLKNLRESTTNEKVRAYHKKFYRPENLCCIILGQIKAEDVFEALTPVEERILQEGERTKLIRPWQTPVPPLVESITVEVEYPADQEEYGMIMAAFRGPLYNDFITLKAVLILLEYLTDTSVALLNREFVENDDPLCNSVEYTILKNSSTSFYLSFMDVPVPRFAELKEKFFALLKDIIDGNEKIDMERMITIVKTRKLDILSCVEGSPDIIISNNLIADFLYGSSKDDFDHSLKEIPTIEKLLEKDSQYWVNLIKTYMVDGNHVVVLGAPSSALSDRMAEEEETRVKLQQEKLGTEGLKEKGEILKKALEQNAIPAPKELLRSVEVTSLKSIKFPAIKRICNVLESHGDDVPYSVRKMPCRFQVDCISTNFVRLFVLVDTSHLSVESRMYLPLVIELLDECAINRNGEIVPYQDVVKQLAEDTMSISSSLGFDYERFFCTNFAQILFLNLMVEEEKYERSVQWVQEILFKIVIEPSRVKSAINKMVTNVPSLKQCGEYVVKSMMTNLCYQRDSNHWTASLFRQHVFLTKLKKQLKNNPDEIVSELNYIRKSIIQPDKMIVHLALNLDSIKKKLDPEKAWLEFFPSVLSPAIMKSNLKKCSEYVVPFADSDIKGLIAGIGSEESAYLMQTSACSIENLSDYASLLVLSDYFNQLEGPMGQQIRGQGYAYFHSIFISYDTGLIYFELFDCSHVVKAYKESINIIDSHFNGTTQWSIELLESARSSAMFKLINTIETSVDAVSVSLRAFCCDPNIDAIGEQKELLQKISEVTTIDIDRVGLKYLKPLFTPTVSRCTVTCNSSKVNEIVEEFKKLSRELNIVPSLDDNFMCKY